MDKSELLARVTAGEWKENNGKVLRTLNILEGKYIRLSTLSYALPDLTKGDILRSINYLEEEAYIRLRTMDTHELATISDYEMETLEAKLSGKGLRLLTKTERDACVVV